MSDNRIDSVTEIEKPVSLEESEAPLYEFKVPFPPEITTSECITLKDGKIPTKSPNCFIIYRRAFQKELRAKGYVFKLNLVSAMASQSWQREPPNVKKIYKEFARQINVELVEMRATKNKSVPKETSDQDLKSTQIEGGFEQGFKQKKDTAVESHQNIPTLLPLSIPPIPRSRISPVLLDFLREDVKDTAVESHQNAPTLPFSIPPIPRSRISPVLLDFLQEDVYEAGIEFNWQANQMEDMENELFNTLNQSHESENQPEIPSYPFELAAQDNLNFNLYPLPLSSETVSSNDACTGLNDFNISILKYSQTPETATISSDIWLANNFAPEDNWESGWPMDIYQDETNLNFKNEINPQINEMSPRVFTNDLLFMDFMDHSPSLIVPSIFEDNQFTQ
ncbi:hypothetical protein G9A89_010650 [Geosiphon pyriformis]|nr:hypothetical protein G9A89_010650 [Geosiphon pyriformis]